MVQNSVCACVQDCVCACFKDSYSQSLAQTSVARKTKKKVFVLEQRESWQAVELSVHFPISYQLDLDHYYFTAALLRSHEQKEVHSSPTNSSDLEGRLIFIPIQFHRRCFGMFSMKMVICNLSYSADFVIFNPYCNQPEKKGQVEITHLAHVSLSCSEVKRPCTASAVPFRDERVRAVSREHKAKTTFPAKAAKCRSTGRASVESPANEAGGPQGAPAAPQHTSSPQILLFSLCCLTLTSGEINGLSVLLFRHLSVLSLCIFQIAFHITKLLIH